MRKSFENISVGVLVLLANAGVAIPYFFCLMLYNQHKTEPVYALPFLMLYTFRCIGMLLTAHIKRSAATMLNVSSFLGIIGSIFLLFSGQAFFGIVGGILLGLSSSWIWPYFLTIRSRAKLSDEFTMNKDNSISALIALVVLLVVAYFASAEQVMGVAFIFLAILFVFSWFGGYYLKHEIDFYDQNEPKSHWMSPDRIIINLVALLILIILIFSIRYSRLTATSHVVDLVMCGLAAIVLIALIYFQLDIHRKIFPLSLGALNRGVVMNYLLLYSAFDTTLRFKFNSMVMVFVVYMVGFQFGPILLKKYVQYRYPMLLVGLLLTLLNFAPVYFFGLLLCSLFIGSDNVILNNSLYSHPNLDGERAFLIKYQLSSIGNISQQLVYMALIYIFSFVQNINVLSFFNASVNGASYNVLTLVHTIIVLGIFLVSSLTFYFVRKQPLPER